MQRPSYPSTFRAALLVFVGLVAFMEFPGARDLVDTPYSGIETQNLLVRGVDAVGPNAAVDVRRGDEIAAVDGQPVRNYNHFRHLVRQNTELAPQAYTLRRDNRLVEVPVSYVPVPVTKVYRRFTFLLVGFTFLLMSLLVLARRTDAVGTLFALNCAILAFFLTDRPVYGTPFLQLAGELLDDAMILAFPAVFLHFFLVFHDRPDRTNRRRRRMIVLYGPPAFLFLSSTIFAVQHFLLRGVEQAIVQAILIASTLYMVIYLVMSLIIFIRNYRASAPAQKEKLRIAIFGTAAGITPFAAMVVWRQIDTGSHVWESLSVLSLSLVSISFAYAILKHGAIELNIVIRKSLGYALLTGAVVAVYYAIVNVVGDVLQSRFHMNSPLFSIMTVLVLAVIFAPARDLVQRTIDRVFARGDYDYKTEVVAFNRSLARRLNRNEILDSFERRMQDLLGASLVAMYMPRDGGAGDWARERSAGDPDPPSVFPKASMLGRYLTRYKKPLMVEYMDYAWGSRNLDNASRAFLETSRASVCVPLFSSNALLGVVVLGGKRSGQLYTSTDAQLLERFAEHLGLVLENAELHETAIEQARLKNELMLARDIQLSLLPAAPPKHPSLRMEGRMASSNEVGGDYFDYFPLPPGRVGVCIGDVSGKGVPAAMLMSSLQAVFRNLAVRDRMNPVDVVSELNRFLCDSAEGDQFATFFYGILDPDRNTFTYANAGHCPVLLVRQEYTDRLGEGGLPLGVDPISTYSEGKARIDEGDVLCLYTDGVTEQSGALGEQFGDDRLIALLRTIRTESPSALLDTLFARILDFGDGVQSDDLTCIIIHHTEA